MFDRLTSFSISNPPPTTKVVLVHHNGDKTFTTVPLLKRRKASKTMSSSHYRSSSPGGRRIANPARMSDSFYTTSNPYGSPRASTERVIPLSTTTYIGGIPRISDSRLEPSRLEPSRLEPSRLEPSRLEPSRLEPSYGGGRPRRSSTLGSAARPSSAHGPPRSRPAVIQAQPDRPPSPLTRSHNQDYYVAPANSTRREHTHKKVYSIDEGKSHLVADIDINTQPRSRDRRGSVDRNGYLSPASGHSSSHRNSYHLSGPQPKRKDHVDIGSGFSYTDPAGMYRDTEPRRRHRSGSVEDARPRPSSMVVESFPQSRPSARERGPPTSSALDRYNETLGVGVGLSGAALGAGLQRGGSLRDPVRAPTTNRLSYQEPISGYTSSQEHGHTSSHKRHSTALHQERPSERRETYPPPREVVLREPYDERRELRDADRSRPIPRGYEDRSVESRGFGIRAPSLDRYGSDRGSDESLRRRQPYLERSAVPPREDAAVAAKREQERRDYDYARELERSERERPRERERERERDRDYREPDRKDRDRPRDDQAYMSDRDRDRARPSRDGPNYRDSDRDRRDRDRYNGPPRGSAENLSGILPVAIGGLGAAAAAAYGAGDISAKNREREKERSEREKDRGHHSPPESDREDRRRRRHDREHRVAGDSPPSDRERERRIPVTTSDPPPSDRERERRIPVTTSEPSKQPREQERDRTVPDPPAQAPLDPDEEYRRRVQQAQREIGAVPSDSSRRDHGASEGSPDAEHRRRDRDRERERERPDRNDRSHYRDPGLDETPPPRALRRASPDETNMPGAPPSALDRDENAARANRVRIVDPPKEKDEHATVRGILRKPTEKFPEDPNPIREGVAPLKDGKNKDIPLDARWTRISRELVNPECLEEAKERFEEREDCVIVLRVLTKEDIQKLADRTAEIRYTRYEEASRARHDRRRSDKDHDRRERDEYSDHSEDEYAHREPRLLEGSAPDHDAPADFVRDRRRDRERNDREREPSSVGSSSRDGGAYMSGGL